jgi:hypothetical protein
MPIHRAWGWLGVVDYVLLLRALSGLLACWRGRRRLGLAVVLAAAVLAATEVAITYASRPMLWWLVWEWKTPAYLATLGSTDSIAHEHVAVLLNRHGIDWWGTSGAGTGYEVFCPQDSARAVRIIKADALTYGYEVRLRGGWRTPKESVPPTVKRDIRKPMAALLSMPEWADRTELGALLRCRRVQDDAAICPFVRSIAIQKRPYRGSNGDLQIGYCVELELVREGDDDSCLSRMGYLVWDGGRRIGFLGGARYGLGWPVSENGELREGGRR